MQSEKDLFYLLAHKKLAGEASPPELEALEDLLRRHPDWHYIYENLSQLWQQPLASPSHIAAEAAFERHLQRLHNAEEAAPPTEEKPNKTKTFKKPFALAAATVLLAFVAIVLWQSRFEPKGKSGVLSNEVHARPGAKTRIDLPDGSVVWLNAGSRLVYDNGFGKKERRVTLVGEGYFDVAPDARNPFVVHTDALDIKVLGTIFNVKAYPHEAAEASLIEGSIQAAIAARPHEVIVLKPHEKIVVPLAATNGSNNAQNKFSKRKEPIVILEQVAFESEKDSMPVETAWMGNKLVFRDEAFEDLARRLQRWYGVTIQFGDADVKRLRFTGAFKNESLPQVLKALQITGQFQYQIKNDSVFISTHM